MATPKNQKPNKAQAHYVRQQKGHSVVKWVLICLFTGGLGLIAVVYYCKSPNHYWHL